MTLDSQAQKEVKIQLPVPKHKHKVAHVEGHDPVAVFAKK